MLWLIYWWIVAAIVDARFWISRGIAKRSRGSTILYVSNRFEKVRDCRTRRVSFNCDLQVSLASPCESLAG